MTVPASAGRPALGVLLSLLLPGVAEGQGWSVDLHGGRVTYETLPISSQSTNAVLGARYGLDRRSFRVAAGVPVASGDLLWGVASLGDRFSVSRGSFEIGVDGLGQAHLQRDRAEDVEGWGGRGEVLPMLSISSGSVVMEARSGGSFYRGAVAGDSWTRNLHVSDVRLHTSPGGPFRLSGDARHLRGGDEEHYTFVGASGSVALAPGLVWGSLGKWVSGLPGDAPSVGWELGGTYPLPVAQGSRLWASVRREAFDPFFLAGQRTSWGVGFTYPLGGSRGGPPAAGPEERRGGLVVMRLPLSDAPSRPMVAGDFTSWEPVPMTRQDGHWRLEMSLEPGIYHYAFRTSDGEWFVPESVPNRREDGMGGWVAVLIVTGDGG